MGVLGPEVGFISTCSFAIGGGGLCGQPSSHHLMVPEDDGGVVGDNDLGYIITDSNSIFACYRHVGAAEKMFPLHAIHEVNPACGNPESIWLDPGCVIPPEGLIAQKAALAKEMAGQR